MSQNSDEDAHSLHDAVTRALEAVRVEVVGRMTQQKIPLSVTVREPQIIDYDGGGWRSDWATVQQSALRTFETHERILDNTVPSRLLGLRPQLEPLASLLDSTTDLGTRPANLVPGMSGVDAILVRYVTPLAYEYLGNLPDLAQSDSDLLKRLTSELEDLIAPDVIRGTSQLAIAGVRVSSPLEYRAVKVRPLSPSERGHYWQSRNDFLLRPQTVSGQFFIPLGITSFMPSTLLEVTTSRPRTEQYSQSTFMNQVALAFYLLGYAIASPGIVVNFDHPTWATMGQHHQRYLVDEKAAGVDHLVSAKDFHRVVDLAYQIPTFGPSETSKQEIALYRTLRGLGMHWQESGFLDFVIALEAALLPNVETELSYRFKLYGSLFLGSSVDPHQTFMKLHNIYTVRSKLVHGSKVLPTKRQQAADDAPELVKAIILKAVQEGWPEQNELDKLALQAKV